MKYKTIGILAVVTMVSSTMMGATLMIVDIPNTGSDAASGISTLNTYTHKLDFTSSGNTGTALSINGVTFNRYAPTLAAAGTFNLGTSATISTTDILQAYTAPSPSTYADGDMRTLITGATDGRNGTVTISLSNLIEGTQYSTRIYYRNYSGSNRTGTWTFTGDVTDATKAISVNQSADALAHYIAYDFIAAGTSMSVSLAKVGDTSGIYGLTNQVIIPEPSCLALIGFAGIAGCLRRRR